MFYRLLAAPKMVWDSQNMTTRPREHREAGFRRTTTTLHTRLLQPIKATGAGVEDDEGFNGLDRVCKLASLLPPQYPVSIEVTAEPAREYPGP